jgi:transposase InsO family protein
MILAMIATPIGLPAGVAPPATAAAARPGVAAFIEDCNYRRRHSALGRISPVAYEQALAAADRKEAA